LALPAAQGTAQGAAVEPVAKDQVVAIMGHPVMEANGEQIGRIRDVLVDSAGQPRAAVIDVGGFMGIGARTIAVEWKTLRFEPWRKKRAIVLEMSLDAIKAMPAFKGLPANKAAPVIVPAAKAPPVAVKQAPTVPPPASASQKAPHA
jgi:hypothetical protein